MKKFFKYLGRIVLAIFLLLFFLVFLLYLPPVQTFLKNQAVAYFSETYNLTLKIGHFRLGFPLDLVLEDVYAGATPQDTLVSVESLHVKIGVSQIFRQQLSVDDLKLQKVKFNLSDDSSRLELNVKLEEMNLFARQVDLKKKRVDADHIFLCGGEVFLQTGDGVEPDTVVAEPLDWEFRLGRIELRQLGYRMNTTALPYLGVGVAEGDLIGGVVNMGTQVVRVDTLNIAGDGVIWNWLHPERMDRLQSYPRRHYLLCLGR
ncbi:MAG: AsmA family protein [Odoribacter sp.]